MHDFPEPNSTPGAASASQNLFVYGSLLAPGRLDEVIGRRHAGERLRARLRGFRRVRIDAYEFPFAVCSAVEAIEGMLIMDLSEDDLRRLDAYEDVQADVYRRVAVEVEAWRRGPHTLRVTAWTYIGGDYLTRLANAPLGEHTPANVL